jgi:hypothetical protein
MFKIFSQLINLQFHQLSNNDCFELSFDNEIPIFSSSILLELHVTVSTSIDLLCLLDGRLNEIRRFYVYVQYFFDSSRNIDMKVRKTFIC